MNREAREIRRERDSEPPEGGWDEADRVTEMTEEPRPAPKPARLPPESPSPNPVVAAVLVERPPEARVPEMRAPATVNPATREEIWTIVRAAVEEAVAPVSAKLRDTEARLDRAEREIATRPAGQAPPTPRSGGVAPPARDLPNLPPDAFPHDDVGTKRAIQDAPEPMPVQKPSYKPTSYGFVSAHPPGPRPGADLDLSNVGPIDVPDFGNRRRLVGRIVVGLMLLGVAGAIVATVLSHA